MTIRVYNTMTKMKEVFQPVVPGKDRKSVV